MNAYLLPGLMGLLTGLVLHWCCFSRHKGLQNALGLRRSLTLRTALTALGWGLLLTALLMWLAVIDVDLVQVLPLSPGTLLGGTLMGICAGLSGYTPTTAFAGLGAGNATEALCLIAGCFAGTALFPLWKALFSPLHQPWLSTTLFEVTLDEPWLFSGGYLGLGCLGALLAVWGMCIPSPGPVMLPDEIIAARAAETAAADDAPDQASGESAVHDNDSPAEEDAPAPEAAAAETIVAALEGEEPLVIDTALDEPEAPEDDRLPSDN